MLSPILENLTKQINRETIEQRRKLHCNTMYSVIWLTLIELLVSSSQERVGLMLPWYLNLLWFYPTCSPTCFQPKFPWSEKKIAPFPWWPKMFVLVPHICFLVLPSVNSRRSALVFPWSQQSNQEFRFSLKIIWQDPLFPTNKCSFSRVPRWEGIVSYSIKE